MAGAASSREARGMTTDEVLALPAVIDLDTANRALMIGRSTGYGLAKQEEYPVKVLRLGNAYRVVTADLLKLLGLAQPPPLDGQSAAEGSARPLRVRRSGRYPGTARTGGTGGESGRQAQAVERGLHAGRSVRGERPQGSDPCCSGPQALS